MKSLASDNYSSVSPEILEYLVKEVNIGHARAYGNDEYTLKAKDVIKKVFELPDADVHFVLTGTAANVLSFKQCLKSTASVLVARSGHTNTNETGSPEVISHTKLLPIDVHDGKIDLSNAQEIVNQEMDNIPHAPRPSMLSIAQSTEYGTIYTLDELKAIHEFCVQNSLLLHLDLCRVYNAAAALNTSLASIVDAAKPDIFSLGGTKNGLMFAEAVVIINNKLRDDFVLLQKQSMQLYSKMRYLSAQFIPYFEQELWLKNAKQANDMCTYLYKRITQETSLVSTIPVQTNHIFITLPKEVTRKLQEITPFYVWDVKTGEVRFVTSFDTMKEEIDLFVDKLKEYLTA